MMIDFLRWQKIEYSNLKIESSRFHVKIVNTPEMGLWTKAPPTNLMT